MPTQILGLSGDGLVLLSLVGAHNRLQLRSLRYLDRPLKATYYIVNLRMIFGHGTSYCKSRFLICYPKIIDKVPNCSWY